MEEQEQINTEKLHSIAKLATLGAFIAAYKMLDEKERKAWGITIFIFFFWYQYKYNPAVRKVCNYLLLALVLFAIYLAIFPPTTVEDMQQENWDRMMGK